MSAPTAWIDATAGVAGDMLLAALIDAGAELEAVRASIRAVLADRVELELTDVTRAGLRARRVQVVSHEDAGIHRDWAAIRTMLTAAELPDTVRAGSLAVFARLAEAEGAVHGVAADLVQFHEVGALDSIADIVGCVAALHALGVSRLRASPIRLGSGQVRTAHGQLPVPVPAVLQLARGWPVYGDGAQPTVQSGELATPTGVALITTLAECAETLPPMRIGTIGVGAGTSDPPDHPNVVRVVLGETEDAAEPESQFVIEANVDDMDPRLWPGVLDELLRAGAADAWLTPILMKKGRPAHTVHVLCPPDRLAELQSTLLCRTSTIGLRTSTVSKLALPRLWVDVAVADGTARIKIAHRDGVILQATAEFEDVEALARATGRPAVEVHAAVQAAAAAAGLLPGRPLPTATDRSP